MRKRQLKMYFWINKEERDFIDREVAKTELSREGFLRSRILRKAIPLKHHPDLSRLIRELNAIGNNINQIARQAHLGKPIPKAEFFMAKKTFEEMETLMLEVIQSGTDKDLDKKMSGN